MTKLRADIRVGMLGAAGGLFSISVFLMIARVDAYYNYLSWLEETGYFSSGWAVEDLWWVPVSFWHVLLSVTASLMAHRYLAAGRKSPFLVWQLVGIITLLGWGFTFGIGAGLDCLMHGEMWRLERTLRFVQFAYLAKYVSVVIACYVLFGTAMLTSARHYEGENPNKVNSLDSHYGLRLLAHRDRVIDPFHPTDDCRYEKINSCSKP